MTVLDATLSVVAGAIVTTPLIDSWRAASPDTLEQAAQAVSSAAAWLWDPVALWILGAPGFAVFAALALLLYAIGRPRRRPAARSPFYA
jgi:hypothetical protein